MRGERFKKILAFGVDRIRRLTEGKAEILLLTTCPAVDRWETMKELSAAVRAVAAEKKTGLADIEAAFYKAGAENKERLYCKDKVHLGPEGHKVFAQAVQEAIEKGGAAAGQ